MQNDPVPSAAAVPLAPRREVSVTLASYDYSVPRERVLAIVPVTALIRFNWHPTFVSGMCFPPGLAAPVLNLRLKYNLRGEYASNAMILVASASPRGRVVPIGFLVDAIGVPNDAWTHAAERTPTPTEVPLPCERVADSPRLRLDLDLVANPILRDWMVAKTAAVA